jgi:6-pyruvoyltetrahydropterin/6-carboxytetrahydropterin synthase
MQITKILRFEACHSVKDAYTCRCDRERTDNTGGGLHGHSYVVEITLDGRIKNDGMVLDFSLLKEHFNYIVDAFDHTTVVNREDKVMKQLIPYLSSRYIIFDTNPTAENMALYFFKYIAACLPTFNHEVTVHSVTVWETVTGKATCTEAFPGVPPMYISASIANNWNEAQKHNFLENNGLVLKPTLLIKDIDIQPHEVFGREDSIRIIATF